MELCKAILDSLDIRVAVLNQSGVIIYTNNAWNIQGVSPCCKTYCINSNYLEFYKTCSEGCSVVNQHIKILANNINYLLHDKINSFICEYPSCSLDTDVRWYMVKGNKLVNYKDLYIVYHQDITDKKASESELNSLIKQDPLTKIANRRYFDQFLEEEWARCKRTNSTLSLIMLDIDNFKRVNDNYGHIKGDCVLINLANLLKDFTRRPSDLAARYGGEEFVLVLGDTTKKKALLMAETIRQAVPENLRLNGTKITVSIGVASIRNKSHNVDYLIKEADKNLYKAKNTGRNKVLPSSLLLLTDRSKSKLG